MNVLARTGHCDRALDVLKTMMELKLKPNLSACHFLLTNCSKHKQGKAAFEMLGIMRKVGLRFAAPYSRVPSSCCCRVKSGLNRLWIPSVRSSHPTRLLPVRVL